MFRWAGWGMLWMMLGIALPGHAFDWKEVPLAPIHGEALTAADLEGKVVLVVNVASRCGYTSQYSGLQSLYERFKERGLVILGVPCNQFMGQEPGTEKEIVSFCSSRYGVTFPLLEKQKVNGASRSPLYRALVDSAVGKGKKVGWNFEKFLVGRDGAVLSRYGSSTAPKDAALISAIEGALK